MKSHAQSFGTKLMVYIALMSLFGTDRVYAWGERGHDLITRVAARLVHQKLADQNTSLGDILLAKEHMLGHLSNVPDIVWRNGHKHVVEANGPTHFIDLEFLYPANKAPKGPSELPGNLKQLKHTIRKQCEIPSQPCPHGKGMKKKVAKTGHAPFRIEQLYDKLRSRLSELSEMEKSKNHKGKDHRQFTQRVNEALTMAGILSHFVADLGNPHHTSMNYDGWLSDQGGIHSYFETQVLNQIDLNLDHQVFVMASEKKPFQAAISNQRPKSVLEIAWILALDSHARLSDINGLDQKFAVVKPSKDKAAATRQPPENVKDRFEAFTIERLAVASEALAMIWIKAWQEAGKPKLEGFKSYEYPLEPSFIDTTYLKP